MVTPRPLSAALDKIARAAVGKDWSLYAALLEHWTEIVGEDYAKSAAPVKIGFPKGKSPDEKWAGRGRTGGVLTIRLPQGLVMEFSFLSETIRGRINGFFGYPAIEKLLFEAYYPTKTPKMPLEEPQLDASEKDTIKESLKHLENNELQDVLQNLGESIRAAARQEK